MWSESLVAAGIFGALVLIGAFATVAEQQWFSRISVSGWGLSWALVLIYAAPVVVLFGLLGLFRREPVRVIAAALSWGGLAAASFAGIANQGWGLVVARVGGPQFASVWTAALTAPFVEELLKLAGVVLLCIIVPKRITDTLDGFLLGALVGLGFAIVEDVFYFMSVFGGTSSGIISGFFVRVAAGGVYGHVLWSGIAGAGTAYVITRRPTRSRALRLSVALACIAVAIGAHFLWNSPWLVLFPDTGSWLATGVAFAIRALPLVIFIVALVWLVRERESRVLAQLGKTTAGPIPATDLAQLTSWRRRRASQRAVRLRAGRGAAALLRRLQREQIELAMLASEGADPEVLEQQRSLCRSLQDGLSLIPGAALSNAS